MIFAGLDIGTSGCKCVIADENGKEISISHKSYTTVKNKGHQEIDSDVLRKSVFYVIKDAVAKSGGLKPQSISLTSFGESCVVLDENGKTLSPIILYTDSRGVEECAELNEKFTDRHIFNITGHHTHIMFFLPKLMWMKKHQPEMFNKIRYVLPITSFIIYSLTGIAACDYSLCSRLLMFDIYKKEWSKELLSYAGIDERILPKPVVTGSVVGNLSGKTANELGLSPNTTVVAGPQDQIACAIGTGCIGSEYTVNGSGSVDCYTPIYDISLNPINNEDFYKGGFPILPSFEGVLTSFAFVMNSCTARDWYMKSFMPYMKRKAARLHENMWDMTEDYIKYEPSGILFLPHFTGSATPYMDPFSKSIVVGLNMEHTPADLFAAMMEGITFDGYKNLLTLRTAGIDIKKMRITGGGAKSPAWVQLKSDVFDMEISTVTSKEAGAIGCVMLAAIASGCYSSFDQAIEACVHEKKIYYPDQKRGDIFREEYEKHKVLYDAFKAVR